MTESFQVKPSDIDVSSNKVTIRNSGLINALVHDQTSAEKALKDKAPSFKLSDLRIGESGKVVIHNQELASKLQAELEKPNLLSNTVCGNNANC